jgi:hypothetical protein
VVAGLLLAAWAHGFTTARLARAAGALVGWAAAPVVAAWALLCLAMPAQEALRGTLGSWWYVSKYPMISSLLFYKWGLGTDDVAGNLAMMLRATAWYGALLIPAALLMLACRRPGWHRSVIAAVLFVVPASWMWCKFDQINWDLPARPWPLFMVVFAAAALTRFIRSRCSPDRGAQAALAVTTAVFAFALLSKMILKSRVYQYGFVLGLPAGVLMVPALLDWAPQALDRRGGFGGGFRALALSLILAGVCAHVRVTAGNLSCCKTEVGSGADAFRTLGYGEAVGITVTKIMDATVGRSQTLAVLPEGVLINYLSRRPNPTPYTTFLGVELEAFGEEHMTESYKRHPPDFILLVHRDSSEYGRQFFGRDFGVELYRWIRSCYRPVGLIGDVPLQQPGTFGMLLFRHNEESGDAK